MRTTAKMLRRPAGGVKFVRSVRLDHLGERVWDERDVRATRDERIGESSVID